MSPQEAREKITAVKNQLELGAVVVELLKQHNEIEKSKDEGFLQTAERLRFQNPQLSELMAYANHRWMELEKIRRG